MQELNIDLCWNKKCRVALIDCDGNYHYMAKLDECDAYYCTKSSTSYIGYILMLDFKEMSKPYLFPNERYCVNGDIIKIRDGRKIAAFKFSKV